MGPEGLNLVERNNCNTLTQLAILEQLGSNNLVVDNDLFKIRKKTICQRLHFPLFKFNFQYASHMAGSDKENVLGRGVLRRKSRGQWLHGYVREGL